MYEHMYTDMYIGILKYQKPNNQQPYYDPSLYVCIYIYTYIIFVYI
jgi:hypothetical protein